MDNRLTYVPGNLYVSEHPDGLAILHPDSGYVYVCDWIGARIFSALSKGLTIDAIAADLAEFYGVEFEIARQDARAFIENLTDRGLLSRRPVRTMPRRELLVSLVLYELLLFDMTMDTVGFRSVSRRLTRDSVSAGPTDPALTAMLCDAVNLAISLYPRRVQCLQQSVATVHLLWKYGIPGRLVIAYRPSPFMAHAFVEVNDQVVNDSPEYGTRLQVLCKF